VWRAAVRRNYDACAQLTGPLTDPPTQDHPVRFRPLLSPDDRAVLTALVVFSSVTAVAFISWLVQPSHVPGDGVLGLGDWRITAARVMFCLMVAVELIRLGQNACVLVFAFNAKDPVPMTPVPGLRVALITTIVPSREPIDIVARSLAAMRQVTYAGQVDVWILDEGDDPQVKAMAARLGVHHFSRKGRPEYNQPAGLYKARTKAGNHNAWRAEHEHGYDIVGVFDPDHVVRPYFLERTLGYFRDPDVAFVVSPQVYGNMYDSFLTHGASGQQWLFNGIIERAGNGLRAPMLTGTNNLYRPQALAQVGGFQSSVVEDHLTSIHIHANRNPRTGNNWLSVYTPDVLAIGEGPNTWTDYFSQQKRWAYGNNEIVTRRRVWPEQRLPFRQRAFYCMLQFYYPSVAASWVMGNAAVATYLALGTKVGNLHPQAWGVLWGASVVSCFTLLFWLRRFHLAEHERREWGVPAYILSIFAAPIYVAAAAAAVFRRPLSFTVTAKGRFQSVDSVRTFRLHTYWGTAMIAVISASLVLGHRNIPNGVWALVTLASGVLPLVIAALAHRPAPATQAVPAATRTTLPAPARSTAWVDQQGDRQSRELPRVVDDVTLPQRPFVGVAKVVQRVEVEPGADQPDPLRVPEPAGHVGALDGELHAARPLEVHQEYVGRPAVGGHVPGHHVTRHPQGTHVVRAVDDSVARTHVAGDDVGGLPAGEVVPVGGTLRQVPRHAEGRDNDQGEHAGGQRRPGDRETGQQRPRRQGEQQVPRQPQRDGNLPDAEQDHGRQHRPGREDHRRASRR
jgi:cellulose synthase/poly-beta-1,6-N-acetylglucosamine synthase-like glycosyltransferase